MLQCCLSLKTIGGFSIRMKNCIHYQGRYLIFAFVKRPTIDKLHWMVIYARMLMFMSKYKVRV